MLGAIDVGIAEDLLATRRAHRDSWMGGRRLRFWFTMVDDLDRRHTTITTSNRSTSETTIPTLTTSIHNLHHHDQTTPTTAATTTRGTPHRGRLNGIVV